MKKKTKMDEKRLEELAAVGRVEASKIAPELKDYEDLLVAKEWDDRYEISPKTFLSREVWQKVHEIVKAKGGEWTSLRQWVIPRKEVVWVGDFEFSVLERKFPWKTWEELWDKELKDFLHYMGRNGPFINFAISMEKIWNSKLNVEEIVKRLEKIVGQVPQSTIEGINFIISMRAVWDSTEEVIKRLEEASGKVPQVVAAWLRQKLEEKRASKREGSEEKVIWVPSNYIFPSK